MKKKIYVIFDPVDGPTAFSSLKEAHRDTEKLAQELGVPVAQLGNSATDVYEFAVVRKHAYTPKKKRQVKKILKN